MKTFFKGFCIGLLSLSLLGLLWFLVLQPGLTNKEAQDLKEEYAQPLPGESSGELPAGKEQAASLVNLSALQAEYPDIQAGFPSPAPVWITLFCRAAPMNLNTICGAPTRASIVLPEAFSFSGTVPRKAGTLWSTGTT